MITLPISHPGRPPGSRGEFDGRAFVAKGRSGGPFDWERSKTCWSGGTAGSPAGEGHAQANRHRPARRWPINRGGHLMDSYLWVPVGLAGRLTGPREYLMGGFNQSDMGVGLIWVLGCIWVVGGAACLRQKGVGFPSRHRRRSQLVAYGSVGLKHGSRYDPLFHYLKYGRWVAGGRRQLLR